MELNLRLILIIDKLIIEDSITMYNTVLRVIIV